MPTLSGKTKALLVEFLEAALTRSEINLVVRKAGVPDEMLKHGPASNKTNLLLSIIKQIEGLNSTEAQEIILNLFHVTVDEHHGIEKAEARYDKLRKSFQADGFLDLAQATVSSKPPPVGTSPGWLPPGQTEELARAGLHESTSLKVTSIMNKPQQPADARKVFVVHGRNDAARRAMFEFLRSINLEPIDCSMAWAMTGKPSPYIGEILDAAFGNANAVVVLFTGDDEARLRPHLRGTDEKEELLTPQARPNVLFESGMAMGMHPDRTILVELGQPSGFSDIAGRHAVRLTNNPKHRQELANRLRSAGCAVDLSGTDWHDFGDFDKATQL